MRMYREYNDRNGDLIDVAAFCCELCAIEFHVRNEAETADDWQFYRPAHGGPDGIEYCRQCGVVSYVDDTYEDEPVCESVRDNIVINRFESEAGERCECGEHWIQLPSRLLERNNGR